MVKRVRLVSARPKGSTDAFRPPSIRSRQWQTRPSRAFSALLSEMPRPGRSHRRNAQEGTYTEMAVATLDSWAESGTSAAQLDATGVCAWFSGRLVLSSVDLRMARSQVTALIGPSGCGKSTFLRILNRMHEVVPGAQLAGSVELDGVDIYGTGRRATDTRRDIGMVFQKPNPFPAMTISENVLSGLKFSRTTVARQRRARRGDADQGELVERGEGPSGRTRRRVIRWSAAEALYRPSPSCSSEGAPDGRTVLGSRPDIDAADRGDDHRISPRRSRS